jgi:hypothetical protein
MMKRYLAFAVLILTASLAGQVEHAPTVAQCQADINNTFSDRINGAAELALQTVK